MISLRPGEQRYAFVPDTTHAAQNRYGKTIETVPADSPLRGKTLAINGEVAIGNNPNRYKQHGFYFNADHCIACHACEAACAEKNNTPPHLAFRSVGYLEGGSYPATQRLNISMACNHCDDPVCLKGCPTRAYTKFAEYGAVLQDPDICFGCGYCTWVCPYNAPQLDPKAGHVSKCNMCVDRLEVGLKPACAAACLAGALDFGIIETTPEHRSQLETQIPGFPTPEITHPNIRFQQTASLPRELRRPDSMPLKYVRTGQGNTGKHQPVVARGDEPIEWGLDKLRSREDPLVLFTLVSQLVVGAFLTLFIGPHFGLTQLAPQAHPVAHAALLFVLLGVQTLALVVSTLHLGRPHRFYRAFNNLRHSPVSREVSGIAVFYNLLGAYTLLTSFPALFGFLPAGWLVPLVSVSGIGASLAGVAALWFMHRIYRIPARPFWNHWQVLTSFYGSMLSLGPIAVGLVYASLALAQDANDGALMRMLALPIAAGLALEGIGLWFHARDLARGVGEAQAAHHVQCTRYGKSYRTRNLLLAGAAPLTLALGLSGTAGTGGLVLWFALALAIAALAVVGRMLFYVLVIPTTMPGAFFWRNRGFEEHARKFGLAEMPQVGVASLSH
jgi:DMSO reductase iron-sulfur subunit